MSDRGLTPQPDRLESVYRELMDGRSQGWEEFRRTRPELAAALERAQGVAAEATAPAVSDTFCDRLASLYGGETACDWAPTAARDGSATVADDVGAPRYRILSEVARGGMGIVFEVLDLDLDRVLAMKVIQEQYGQRSAGSTTATSASLVRRFLREAKVTAQLDHPGVVPVYDVGLHPDGCVYFTMRLVHGDDLRDILAAVAAGGDGWTTGRVVDVLLKVCDTVAFCHDRGVIHRDLKPANIRVGRYGEVYVMDWGLARFLDRDDVEVDVADPPVGDSDALQTLEGQVLGTPAYMSPEQAQGLRDAIGPTTDVYAIGAMLYTLLAGTPPYFGGTEAPRSSGVLEELSSGPPRSLREIEVRESERLIDICERAMARDSSDRYASVQELADALRAHRELEREALRDAEFARADAARSRRVSGFLVGLFGALDPNERHGGTVNVESMLERGSRNLERDFADDPLVRAAIERTLGTIHHQLGRMEDAERLFESALRLHESSPLNDDLDEAETLHELANVYADSNRLSEARNAYERALEIRQRRLGDRHELVTETQLELSVVVMQLGDPVAAEALCRQAVSVLEGSLESDNPDMGKAYHNLGFVLAANGRPREGIPYLSQALEIWESALGDHMSTASCMNTLSRAHSDVGDHVESRALALRGLAMRKRLLDEDHPMVASSLQNLATQEYERGRYREAATRSQAALEIRRRRFAEDHPDVSVAKSMLANALRALGKWQEAIALQREVVEARERVLDPGHRGLAVSWHNLGVSLQSLGELAEAEELLRKALAHRRQNLAVRHPEVAINLTALAQLLIERYRVEGAESADSDRDLLDGPSRDALLEEAAHCVDESFSIRRELLDGHHLVLASSFHARGLVEAARGRLGEARDAFREAAERREREDHQPALGESLLCWAELERDSDPAVAGDLATRAIDALTRELSDDHPFVLRARRILEK